MKFTLSVILTLVFATCSQAGLVTGTWTVSQNPNGGDVSNLNTTPANPVIGNGMDAENADAIGIYATIPTYTLGAAGDMISLSATVTFTDTAANNNEAFRAGLYNVNGSTDSQDWLGLFGTSSGGGPFEGRILNRLDNAG